MCLQSEWFVQGLTSPTGVAPIYTNVAHKVLAKAANIKGAGRDVALCVPPIRMVHLGLPYTPG